MKPVSIILVLAVTFSLGNALDWHVCSSAVDQKCPAGQDTYCRKIYQIIRDKESVVRSCGWEEDKVERECYTTVLEEYNTEVCSCKEDGCNSADSVSSMSLATTVITGVLAHLYNRF